MYKAFALFLLVLGTFLLVQAAEDQAFLGVFAETTVFKIPGMPEITLPPGMATGTMAMPGIPQRKLSVRLWSPGIAPDKSFAQLAIPTGLKLGPKLNLDLYRPKPGQVTGGDAGDPGKMPDFTIKYYWGSSATVKPGQPKVIRFGDLTDDQKAEMRREAQKGTDSYFYKPDWTTGYWPAAAKQPMPGAVNGVIAKDASLIGKYALSTNYTGNVEIEVPNTVEFLNPIEMSSPKLDKKVPMDAAITFKWKAIPGILGYHAMITGMQGKNTLIMWSSSETENGFGMSMDYLEMAQVRELVNKNIFMAPDRTEVTVPAGIFKDCDMVIFMMVGYGPGAALDQAQPLPRVQTKTTLTITLSGMDMGGMDMGGDGEE